MEDVVDCEMRCLVVRQSGSWLLKPPRVVVWGISIFPFVPQSL